jgi:hypothetical protein
MIVEIPRGSTVGHGTLPGTSNEFERRYIDKVPISLYLRFLKLHVGKLLISDCSLQRSGQQDDRTIRQQEILTMSPSIKRRERATSHFGSSHRSGETTSDHYLDRLVTAACLLGSGHRSGETTSNHHLDRLVIAACLLGSGHRSGRRRVTITSTDL